MNISVTKLLYKLCVSYCTYVPCGFYGTFYCSNINPFTAKSDQLQFLFQSLTRDISYGMENLVFDSLLRWKPIELSILTTSLIHLFLNG